MTALCEQQGSRDMARSATVETTTLSMDAPLAITRRPRAEQADRERKIYDWAAIRSVLAEEPAAAKAIEPDMVFCFAD